MTQGLALSRAFYEQAIGPVLRRQFPDLPYAAGLIGPGSEVLGFDSDRSRDHHWGPRALLFLRDPDLPFKAEIDACLRNHLPPSFEGLATNFVDAGEGNGVRVPVAISGGPVAHMVEIYSVRSFAQARLALDVGEPITNRRWLTLPQQRLLETTQGEIFHDGTGEITALRESLAYFPHDVWLYLLGCQWQKISQEEAFVGRAAEAGDELGSRLVAARLVREVMRLCFLMERRYWPYSKWFGSAFAALPCAAALTPHFEAALAAGDYPARETALARAYEHLAGMHNGLGITPPLETNARPYHGRPFLVIKADRFAAAIRQTIDDPQLRALPPTGSVDQFTDSTDITERPPATTALGAVYRLNDR
jgi:Domain of unknown function (DUF4037)